jgi:phage gpG-like protein
MNISINIEPTFQAVGKALKQIGEGMQLQQELKAFTLEIEGQSKKVTPVDTGRLRASIFTDIGNLNSKVSPNTSYAIYVHEGHNTRGGRGYVQGRPFMKTGVEVARMKRYGLAYPPFAAFIENKFKEGLRRI